MPIHHAVLALLAEGPNHGYELKASFEESVGPQWGELNIGHLYQILDRLIRDGLATKQEVPQRNRPAKVVYTLTDAGGAELEDWLARPFVREGGYRDDFFLKLFAASRLGLPYLEQVIRAQREAYLQELGSLGQLRAGHERDPLVTLLIEAAVLHTEANLEVVERAERARAEIAQRAPASSTPVEQAVSEAAEHARARSAQGQA